MWSPSLFLRCAPCDYNCFGPLKEGLSVILYPDWNLFKNAIDRAILEGLQRGLFQGVILLPQRWQKVIEKEGHYI